MAVQTIQDLFRERLADRSGRDHEIADLARHIKKLADDAWDLCGEARARCDDETAEHYNGRARAFCEVLGDQEWLAQMGVI
jgi:hypothetical protein